MVKYPCIQGQASQGGGDDMGRLLVLLSATPPTCQGDTDSDTKDVNPALCMVTVNYDHNERKRVKDNNAEVRID